MQLFQENHQNFHNLKINMNVARSIQSQDSEQVKEKRSSDASLRTMNPVASGDNVANLGSTHKLKEELPPLIPCCEGKELQISEELVRTGLSAISVRHDSVVQCLSLSRTSERHVLSGLMKHRNSFRCLHRPDLKRVPYLRRMAPDELEMIFRGFADIPNIGLQKNEPSKSVPPSEDDLKAGGQNKEDFKDKAAASYLCDVTDDTAETRPMLEKKSGAEDVPAGMRLHVAKAKLYTSVLAGANTGDRLDTSSENLDTKIVEVPLVPEDEIHAVEELQIILPPRYDDINTESTITTDGY